MIGFLGAYAIATVILFVLDFIWLGTIATNFYRNQLGDMMLTDIKRGIAAAFYLTYTVGIVLFAVKPAIDSQNILMALGYGALFGFLAYGTYDFTNMATLKDWPVKMSIVDIAWGTFVTGFTAVSTYWIVQKVGLSL